jgi:two-component system CheB/CheR fusion protein
LRAVIEDAVGATRSLLEAQGVELALAIDDVPLNVAGDPSRLQQVFANLLTNAAKYTPAGGHVWLEATVDGPFARVRVRDDGVGIAPDMIDAIFELFVQPNRTLDRSQGGLGVGLTLARSLVEMHGGTLEARSDGEGKGSTFEVKLPLSGTAPRVEARRPALKAAKGTRIVVVEDNVDAREMLCHLLTRAGFDCEAVGDGLAAIAKIQTFKPRAAVIDVGLPGIDGFEVARRIRSDPKLANVVLVAVTGYGQQNDRALAKEAGFDAHMVKPVKFEELMKLLANSAT